MARTATKPKTPEATRIEPEEEAKQSTSTALVNWEEELAKQADEAAKQEANSGSGQFFSLQGGMLVFNDQQLPNDEMVVVIVEGILENVYYTSGYDPDNPSPPTCFAFGRDESNIAPHESVVALGQNPAATCRECPMNEWASAEKGRGKACSNRRRLAMISAGKFGRNGEFLPYENPEDFQTSLIGFMKLPVMSVNGYAKYVKQVAGALRLPPHGVFTKVKVVKDPKSQFRVLFEPLGKVPQHLLGAIMARHQEARATIEFPYALEAAEDEPKERQPARGKVNNPKPGRRKY
jgi:hypothetical protein